MTCRAAFVLAVLVGCMPDDWNGEPYTGPGTVVDTDTEGGTGSDIGFVGSWVSEGADLSELFAAEPFSYERVEAQFGANGDYVVTSTAGDGAVYALTGSWLAQDGAPGTVTLSQVTPYEAEASGIWQVDGTALSWEIVQTVPDYGFVPATPEGGFGSTAGPGLEAGANVQIYRSVP